MARASEIGSVPLKIDSHQAAAGTKRIAADAVDGVGDCDTGEVRAVIE